MSNDKDKKAEDGCLHGLYLRDVYEELWRCRDFELSHVWHRSVFLGAFLIGCYASYGGLVVAALTASNRSVALKLAVNTLAIVIAVGGVFLSVLWIMMAKGSKAWYEKYENEIWALWHENGFAEDEKIKTIGGFGDVPGWHKPQISNWLFNTAGGGYSPSRINIILGQLSLVAWSLCAFIHVIGYKFAMGGVGRISLVCPIGVAGLVVFAILSIGMILLRNGAKSSTLG